MNKFWVRVFQLLTENHIKPGTKSWHDYERAKRAIHSLTLTPNEYTQVIRYITEYIGV